MSSAKANPVSLVGEGIGQPAQTMSLFMIEVIISADDCVPKGRKNMTKHDKTRQQSRLGWKSLVTCKIPKHIIAILSE